jgi:hypothetical protein
VQSQSNNTHERGRTQRERGKRERNGETGAVEGREAPRGRDFDFFLDLFHLFPQPTRISVNLPTALPSSHFFRLPSLSTAKQRHRTELLPTERRRGGRKNSSFPSNNVQLLYNDVNDDGDDDHTRLLEEEVAEL